MIKIPADVYRDIVELLKRIVTGDYWRADLTIDAANIMIKLINNPQFKLEEKK